MIVDKDEQDFLEIQYYLAPPRHWLILNFVQHGFCPEIPNGDQPFRLVQQGLLYVGLDF